MGGPGGAPLRRAAANHASRACPGNHRGETPAPEPVGRCLRNPGPAATSISASAQASVPRAAADFLPGGARDRARRKGARRHACAPTDRPGRRRQQLGGVPSPSSMPFVHEIQLRRVGRDSRNVRPAARRRTARAAPRSLATRAARTGRAPEGRRGHRHRHRQRSTRSRGRHLAGTFETPIRAQLLSRLRVAALSRLAAPSRPAGSSNGYKRVRGVARPVRPAAASRRADGTAVHLHRLEQTIGHDLPAPVISLLQ